MSTFQPANFAASRAFCPSFPMANDKCLSGTIATALPVSLSTSTLWTCDGLNAFAMYLFGSLLHSSISIFSPCNSLTILCILTPLRPTQEPTGSTPSWRALTATLLLEPLSRAIPTISTAPLKISGTSCSNNLLRRSSSVLDTINSGPFKDSLSMA